MNFKKVKRCLFQPLLFIGFLLSVKSNCVFAESGEKIAGIERADAMISVEQDTAPETDDMDTTETFFVAGDHLLLGANETMKGNISTYGLTQSGVTVTYQERVDEFIRPDSDKIGNGTATEINPACAIKYIVDDWENGESLDASGHSRCRYVYCTQYRKDSPAGQILTKSGYLNKFVHYVMYHGAMYYGQLCRHTPYSTGNWRYDYLVTQMAIHVVNGEFTLDNLVRAIRMSNASEAEEELVIRCITAMVQDAWSVGDGAHPGWDQEGWFRTDKTEYTSFTLSEVLDQWTYGGDGYYYTDWIKPILTTQGGYYANYDISYILHECTSGVVINKMYAHSSFSPYRLAIPWETYEAWRETGKTITSTVTIKIPSHWKATEFTASGGTSFQNVCFITSTAQEATYRASISIKIPQASGSLSVKKVSSNPAITNKNANYSLAGAEFELYRVEADGSLKKQEKTYTTDHNGAFRVDNLPIGTYRLKEITPPKGFLLDTTYSKDLVVTADQTTEVFLSNTPKSLSVSVLLQKKDAQTGLSKPQGKGSMADAEFTVRYYTNIMDTDPALSGYKPSRTWIIKTNVSGYSGLGQAYYVRGDEFFKNEAGSVVCPYGTLTIQETKAPKGYLLNSEIYVTKITDGSNGTIKLSNKPVVKERVNEVKIVKKREGTDICLQGILFELEYPDGTKEQAVTDEHGEITFAGLPQGHYVIREIKTGEQYQLNKDSIKFYVNTFNQISDGHVVKGTDESGGTILIEYDSLRNAVITIGNKTKEYCLTIHKTDDRSTALDGAEFTLYEDKEQKNVYQTGVTVDGNITLEGLKVGKKYYLVESKVPDGYTQELDEHGNIPLYELYSELNDEQQFVFYVNGEKYQQASNEKDSWIYFTDVSGCTNVNLSIVNQSNTKLPETGSRWMLPLLITGILAMSAAFLMKKKERKNES